MARRRFLAHLAAWPLAAALPSLAYETKPGSRLKIMMKSAWGSDDPTKAAFPFSHAAALAEAGHEVQVFLLSEAVVLMRRVVAEAVTPVGWPRVSELLPKWLNGKFRSTLVAPVPGRGASAIRTWQTGAPSTGIPRSSCRW
jgi:hypothetical protein